MSPRPVSSSGSGVRSSSRRCSSPSCTHAPYGGEKESALIAATAAHDVAKVQALLDSGANPNAMVKYQDGLYQSPWRLVLKQLRPKHPEDVVIVKAMLKAGADPALAWGEGQALVAQEPASRRAADRRDAAPER